MPLVLDNTGFKQQTYTSWKMMPLTWEQAQTAIPKYLEIKRVTGRCWRRYGMVKEGYNRWYRFWPTRPTEEEKRSAPWGV